MDIVNISFYSGLLFMFIAIYAIKYFENGRVRNFMNTYVVRRWGFHRLSILPDWIYFHVFYKEY